MTPPGPTDSLLLSQRWSAAALPWLLPVALALGAIEVERHWGTATANLYILCLAALAAVWIGLLAGRAWAARFGVAVINGVILAQLAGGLLLIRLGDDPGGGEVLAELQFWSPAICAWWASCYHARPGRALLFALLLFAGFFAGGTLGIDHVFDEVVVQAALLIGLIVLFGRSVAAAPSGSAAQSFDLAMHDSLTNVASRAYFEAEMAHTAAMADRYGQTFSLIVADIDDFRRHTAPLETAAIDRLLRAFAWLIAERIRRSDTVCRWQDDRFAVLLPSTDRVGATMVAEELGRSLAAARLGESMALTASFGVAEHRPGADAMDTWALAEQALARARALGSNRVVCEEEAEVA